MTKFLNNADVTGYISQTSVTSSLLKTDSSGKLVAATAGTDYQSPTTALLPAGGTAGQILSKIDATNYNTQWIDNFANQLKHEVKLGATLTKGTPVYVSSSNGTNMIVSAASNAAEATSSKTLGLLETGGVTNDLVKVITEGLLAGLDTSTATAGDPVWLGPSGTLLYGLANKPVAPVHMVFIGIVTRVQSVNGEIFVKVQNGFELEELHNVAISSAANNQGLFYESATSLWKNKTIATALGYTPVDASLTANYVPKATGATTLANSNIQDSGSLITLGSNSYVNGALGVGISPTTGFNLSVQRNFTGASTSYGIASLGQIQSDVTTARYFYSSSSQASGASTTSIQHFFATQGTFLGTTTSQIGFYVSSTLIGATSNFAFRSDIDLGTNRWNLYMVGTANNYLAGGLGIGSTSVGNGINLNMAKTMTGATTQWNIYNQSQIQSDVTLLATYYRTNASTQATSFTLTDLVHYSAAQGTFGAGSVVTNQYGFYAASSLVDATNDYGFFGNIPASTNRWNLYMNGTADNYLAGSLGIGSTALTAVNFRIGKNITGGTDAYASLVDSTIQSDVTANAYVYRSLPSITNASFTLTNLYHFSARQNNNFSVTPTVTNQYGFAVESNVTGATNNYGFYGNLSAATGRWNLYMVGTAANYIQGSVGLGTTSLTGYSLRVGKNITGATTGTGISSEGVVQSDVTTWARLYNTYFNTVASAFTLTNVSHYITSQGVIGSGSTVTNQHGFYADASLIGATNNFGFYGAIPAGANRWNLYMAGAPNYLQGALGIGSTTLTGFNLRIDKSITGATTSYGIHQGASIQSDVTTAYINNTNINTAATSFTITTLAHYRAAFNVLGAGSAITTQYGYLVESTMSTATNNYAFYSGLTAGTGKWNLYMNGTASNYLNGSLGVGAASINASAKVQIDSTTQGFLPPRMTSAQRTAISTPATGLIVYQTDGVEGLWINTSTGWRELTVV